MAVEFYFMMEFSIGLGEYKEGFSNKAEIGVTCYSSKKLYDLTFRGMGLPVLNQIDSMIQPIGEKVIPG